MKNKNSIYGGIAVAVVLMAVLYFAFRKTPAPAKTTAEKPTEVEKAGTAVREVELNQAQYKASGIVLGSFAMKNLSEVVNANGYTKLPPQNQADVSVYLPGIVKSILVIEGQLVRKGQLLAMLESPEYVRLQQDYLTSKSNLEYLNLEYGRQKTLSDENVNSKKIYQKTKSDYEIEKARFSSLQQQLSLLHLNPVGPATLPILAPIAGYITEITIKLGSNAEVGKPLFSIVDNSKLHVDLLVYEKDLYKVKPGQNIRFVLTNQDNTEIRGKVFNVGKAFENETKSVAVHADILNANQALISGMYVNALIDVGAKDVQSLPVEAVVKAEGREFIFILEAEETEKSEEHGKPAAEGGKHFHFQRIEVKTGTSQLGFVEVSLLHEVPPNAPIVLRGAYYIQSHLLKSEGGGGHEH